MCGGFHIEFSVTKNTGGAWWIRVPIEHTSVGVVKIILKFASFIISKLFVKSINRWNHRSINYNEESSGSLLNGEQLKARCTKRVSAMWAPPFIFTLRIKPQKGKNREQELYFKINELFPQMKVGRNLFSPLFSIPHGAANRGKGNSTEELHPPPHRPLPSSLSW